MPPVSAEDIRDCFGQDISDIVVKTCEEICTTFGLSAEDFHVKYSTVELNKGWDTVTVDHMNEIRGTLKYPKKALPKPTIKSTSASSPAPSTPQAPRTSIEPTAVDSPVKRTSQPPSPMTPSKRLRAQSKAECKYTARSMAGECSLSFQDTIPSATPDLNPKGGDLRTAAPDVVTPIGRYDHMVNSLTAVTAALEKRLANLGEKIIAANNLSPPIPLGIASQSVATYVGRVAIDGEGGAVSGALLLEGGVDYPAREGTSFDEAPKRVVLDTTSVPEVSLFSGQIIAVEGVCADGKVLKAESIYTDAPVGRRKTGLPNLEIARDLCDNKPVSYLVAAGPYMLTNTLDLSPLKDLVNVVKEKNPDVLLLIGPFVDETNTKISLEFYPNGMSTEALAKQKIWQYLNDALATRPTRIFVVPSLRDADAYPCIPQPPMELPNNVIYSESTPHRKMHSYPNPCLLASPGMCMGVTSVDLISAMVRKCVKSSSKPLPDFVCESILNQRSFFPIHPSPENQIDYSMLESLNLKSTPDVMIFPSKLPAFIKLVSNVLFVNPGSLVKATTGGTYAIITTNPHPCDKPGRVDNQAVLRSRVDIYKI